MKKKHFSATYLKWQYFENPVGNAIAISAYENGVIIGHYAAQPILSKLGSEEICGLLILNAAIDQLHQGKGVFLKITYLLHTQATEQNFKFIIGVANKKSTPIYINRFKFQLVGQLDVKIGIGKLIVKRQTEYFYERIWNDKILNWRLNNPNHEYNINQSIDQFFVFKRNFFFISTLMGEFSKFIKFENNFSKSNHFGNLFIGINSSINWMENKKYISFPEFIKPSPLNLIFKGLNNNLYNLAGKNILFRCIDFDAF